jgi:membrane protein
MAQQDKSDSKAGDSGRNARNPFQIPPRGWKQAFVRTWKQAGEDNVSLIAAGVAFYIFLAFVPLLASVFLTYGLITSPEQVAQHIAALADMLPEDAAGIIGDQLENMTGTDPAGKGLGLAIALGIALYGAMRGASSIITALNIVYDVEESRGFIKATLMALAVTIGLILLFVLAGLAISALGFIEALLPDLDGWTRLLLQIGFWALAVVVLTLFIAALYRWAPNREDAKWEWITPGSLIATMIWLAGTLAFGVYVSNFGNYNATYGSLGGIVVFLTWLYLTAYILLLGAELNSELARQTDEADTEGEGQSQPASSPRRHSIKGA